MSLYALLRATGGHPSQAQMLESFDGNLCRCTGYKPIIDAAATFCGREDCCKKKKGDSDRGLNNSSDANNKISDSSNEIDMNSLALNDTLFSPNGLPLKPHDPNTELIFPPALKSYIPMPLLFGNDKKIWFRPVTKLQLLQIKNTYPDCKLVAGASEIQIEIKMKAANYNVSIYVKDIPELRTWCHIPGKGLRIGADLSLSNLESICHELAEKQGPDGAGQVYKVIYEQLQYFAGRQTRNAATPAGNIATASPIADLNPILVAVEAILTVESLDNGEKEISMADFFTGYRQTRLPPDSIITQIFIPETDPENETIRAYKQSKRKDDDISIVTSSMRMKCDDSHRIAKVNLVYGGVGPFTTRAHKTETFLTGRPINSETLELAINMLESEFPLTFGVPGGMASYRKTLILAFFHKFYNTVLSRLSLRHDENSLKEVTRSLDFVGSRDLHNAYKDDTKIVGKSDPHLSALKQVTGEAIYVDDIPPFHNEVFGVQVMSTKAHAKILSVDTSKALEIEGVVGYVDVEDLPSREANWWGALPVGKEQFFADGDVRYVGQCIGVILADNREIAAEAARAVKVEYEDFNDAIFTIEQAIEKNSYFELFPQVDKGDLEKAFQESAHIVEGVTRMGGQEHFYLEVQGSIAVPDYEDGEMKLYTSSQNPAESQEYAAQVTGVPASRIVAKVKRLGGGFGGKETRACQLSSIAAVAAKKYHRPVRMILSRSEDMLTSGQRHPFLTKWKVGLDSNMRFTALEAHLYANAGWSLDLTKGVIERAVMHIDNCYDFPNVMIRGYPCKTNTVSNTAYRGFGGPQGMFAAENIIYEVAERFSIDVEELRSINYYKAGQHTTHYKQPITEDFTVPLMVDQIKNSCNYTGLREEVDRFNESNSWMKRGLALVPTKFGVAFGALFLNQAGALVHIYKDGSILLTHGGTEMGQGLHTKMAMICAEELKVPLNQVFISETSTNTVANTSASAASASSDLNGMAVKNACDQLNERLQPYREKLGPDATMGQMAHAAYFDRVNLSANGFYKTPDIGYVWGDPDPKPMFFYFTQGVAVSMVEVNTLTGDWAVLRTDIKMDIGRPINQAIDYGQIEGAYVQGQGLFTIEESLWLNNGAIFTRGPGAYKIPGFRDIPQIFNVGMLQDRPFKHLKTIHRSKGIGEPPLFLGSCVFFAIRDALLYARKHNGITEPLTAVHSPLTTEKIRGLVGDTLSVKGKVEPKENERSFFVYI